MIDLKYMEKNFDEVSQKLQEKGVGYETIDILYEVSIELKKRKSELEAYQAEQNKLSNLFGQYMKEGRSIDELQKEVKENKSKVVVSQEKMNSTNNELYELLLNIPNLQDDDTPIGLDEKDNVEIKKVLKPKEFLFKPKEHWEFDNGWIDFERGVKLAGSRFVILKGEGARLERALINFFLDTNRKVGFEEVAVPFLNKSNMLQGTGQLPKFKDDLYKVEDEDLYLIPTAEVPLTNMYHDEILKKEDLPILMTGYTPCFRKEAGSAGRDTKGIIRQHQFNKVEMVAITEPEDTERVFELMVENASNILTELGLPHRIVRLCSGDLGFSATKTMDLEVWLPGQGQYREISSISQTGDFQARRAKIRYKDGKKNKLVNTLNGSALAVGRTIVAIMENYQSEDGTIEIPKVLKKYM